MLLEDLGDEVGINQEVIWGIKIFKYLFKESNHLLKTGFVFKLSSELKGNLLRYDLTAGISFLGNDQSTGTTLSTEYLGSHIQPLGWEATFIPLWLFVSLCFSLSWSWKYTSKYKVLIRKILKFHSRPSLQPLIHFVFNIHHISTPKFFNFLTINYLYLHQVLKSGFLSLCNTDLVLTTCRILYA